MKYARLDAKRENIVFENIDQLATEVASFVSLLREKGKKGEIPIFSELVAKHTDHWYLNPSLVKRGIIVLFKNNSFNLKSRRFKTTTRFNPVTGVANRQINSKIAEAEGKLLDAGKKALKRELVSFLQSKGAPKWLVKIILDPQYAKFDPKKGSLGSIVFQNIDELAGKIKKLVMYLKQHGKTVPIVGGSIHTSLDHWYIRGSTVSEGVKILLRNNTFDLAKREFKTTWRNPATKLANRRMNAEIRGLEKQAKEGLVSAKDNIKQALSAALSASGEQGSTLQVPSWISSMIADYILTGVDNEQ